MKPNMSPGDRAIRIALATIAAVLVSQNIVTGIWGILLLLLGAILFITAFVGTCPLYRLLRINTCKKNNHHGTARN